jgi:hypothetical protein
MNVPGNKELIIVVGKGSHTLYGELRRMGFATRSCNSPVRFWCEMAGKNVVGVVLRVTKNRTLNPAHLIEKLESMKIPTVIYDEGTPEEIANTTIERSGIDPRQFKVPILDSEFHTPMDVLSALHLESHI